jgi:hypothetical protein
MLFAYQKTPKSAESQARKRESTSENGKTRPAKQRRTQKESTSSGDGASPKATVDFDDALVAHPSGNNRRRSASHGEIKKEENVKSPVRCLV